MIPQTAKVGACEEGLVQGSVQRKKEKIGVVETRNTHIESVKTTVPPKNYIFAFINFPNWVKGRLWEMAGGEDGRWGGEKKGSERARIMATSRVKTRNVNRWDQNNKIRQFRHGIDPVNNTQIRYLAQFTTVVGYKFHLF